MGKQADGYIWSQHGDILTTFQYNGTLGGLSWQS